MNTINRFIVWSVVTAYVVYAFTLNTAAAVFTPAIEASLHATSVQATIAVMMFMVGFALMQIPAGYLLDRYSARVVVSAGVFLLAVGNFLIAFSSSLTLFALGNLIQGVGASFSFIAAAVLIGQWFKSEHFPILFGITQLLSCALAGYLHYVFAMSIVATSWSSLYFNLCYVGFSLFVLSLIFIKNPPNIDREHPLSLSASLKTICWNPQLWLCSGALATSLLLAYASFWYSKVHGQIGVTLHDSMVVSGLIFLGLGVGTPLVGYLSNLMQSRKKVTAVSLLLGVMFLITGIYLPDSLSTNQLLVQVIAFLIGVTLSGSMLFFTMINEIFQPEVKGVAISVSNAAAFLFNSFLLYLPYCLTSTAEFHATLWVLPLFVVISLIMLVFIRESYPTVIEA